MQRFLKNNHASLSKSRINYECVYGKSRSKNVSDIRICLSLSGLYVY